MTYSFAVLRAALRPDGCAPRRAALLRPADQHPAPDDLMARFDAVLAEAAEDQRQT